MLSVNTGIGLLGIQSEENCYAEADLSFSVSFSVFNPVMCNLSFQNMNDGGTEYNLNRQFSFSSADTGVILSQPPFGPGYSGLLTPGDTYTMSWSQQLTDPYPDPNGSGGQVNSDLNLTAVPEPASSLLEAVGVVVLSGNFYKRSKNRKN